MSNYLLDVNVLIAHAVLEHVHHEAVAEKLEKLKRKGSCFHICPIVELGLIRNTMRIGSLTIEQARELLENERINLDLKFIADNVSANELPDWVLGYRQTTDAYLTSLAKVHNLSLLTIDKAIPEATPLLA